MFKNKKRLLFLILTILWMVLIFNFSSQNSTTSGNLSMQVTNAVLTVIHKESTTTLVQKSELEHIIRKCAHFSIYFLGGIIIYSFFTTFSLSFLKKLVFTQILGSFYASTDELHQIFVSGRGPSVRDVLIDSSGILLFLIIIFRRMIKLYK